MPADIPINENDARIQYVSTGGEPSFAYDFPIFDEDHVEVLRADDTTTDPVTLVITVDYTVTGVGVEAGGTIVPVVTPVSGQIWTLQRDVPEERTADFQTAGPYKAGTVNREEDLQTMMLQQLRRDIDRSVTLADGDTTTAMALPLKAARTSKFLAFDGNGDPVMAAGTSADLGPVSAFINTLLDDVNAAAAQATLGVAIGTDVQAFDAAILKADTSDNLTVGYTTDEFAHGVISSGTVAVDLAVEARQTLTNGGAFTLAPPASGTGVAAIWITNNASAGAVTTSGFTKVIGDDLTTVNGDKFFALIEKSSVGSILSITALQ